MGLIDEKNKGLKSRATVPLNCLGAADLSVLLMILEK
jgi:hypothetical protein